MADFDAFRDLTEAERKNWQNVQRENRGGANRAEYAGRDKARDLVQEAAHAPALRGLHGL